MQTRTFQKQTGSNFEMEHFDQIDFTKKELYFIERVTNRLRCSNYETYLDLLLQIIKEKTDTSKTFVTNAAQKLVQDIEYKIASWRFDRELEYALINPNYGEDVKASAYGHTKVESFNKLTHTTLSHLHTKILAALEEGSFTRRELAERTDISVQSVCGRVNELIKSGQVYVNGTKWDADTQRSVQTLALTSEAEVLDVV